MGIHGRAAHLPGRQVSWGGEWRGKNYVIWVEGIVQETSTFGENLILRRRISTNLTEPCFWIDDSVENQGFEPAAHMFLQHINLGYPLVDAASHLALPACQTRPRDETASSGLEHWAEFQAPTPGYLEQVFYHENLLPGDDGMVEVRLVNPAFEGGRGLATVLRFNAEEYPILANGK